MTVRVLLEAPAIRPPRPMRAANWARRAFLFIGIAALGVSGYVYLDSELYQRYQDWAFDQEATGKTPSLGGFLRDAGQSPTAPFTPSTASVANSPKFEQSAGQRASDPLLIGRIEIPRLRVHAIVKEGVDDHTLRRAVGHVPGTAKPGDDGNVALAAHRDSFFRGLQSVRQNDRIVMETLAARYEYVVESLKVVEPDNVSVLAPSKDPVLTLVTCYPFHYVGNAPKRFVVRARQVGVEARDNASFSPGRSGL